ISGIPSVARRALYEISTLLHQHPRKENPPLDDVIYASTQGSYPPPSASVPVAPPVPWYGGYGDESSRFGPGGFNGGLIGRGEKPEEFSMRIVCSAVKIGGVIGKGGANVKQLQQQTGANIQVEDTSDSEERVIIVSSGEVLWDPVSPTIEAILQLQIRTSEASDKGITTRLLVPSSKVGCLLGQGGHIITEMRRRTKADIRVYSKDDKPKYASSNEELVQRFGLVCRYVLTLDAVLQITGNQSVARDALSEIASRLRKRILQGGNHAEVESHVRPHSFREYAQPEGFPGRGLPPSGGVGAGYTGSYTYEHLK
ncbi:hypothetical protein Taro_036179, partial [Colocasia esculenta]|nr:hypothetical protein [Colocasia esculenta]